MDKPNKIPKVIHYCWFSGEEKPKLVKKCIESWQKSLPDYKIIEWTTREFDVNLYKFTREAYSVKKWAFVADVFRLWVLYNYGGIYLDADVEVLKSFDDILYYEAFTGFENEQSVQAAVLGAVPGNYWMKLLLDYYQDKDFILPDNTYNIIVNPLIITKILKENGLKINNQFQKLNPELAIFPIDYFSPKDAGTRIINITQNTIVIHHFDGSWVSWFKKLLLKISWIIKKLIFLVLKKKIILNNENKMINKLRRILGK